MALQIAPTARRPMTERVPRGYQTLATGSELLVPLILLYAILLPAGLALEIAGAVIPPYRLAAMILTPLAIRQMVLRKIKLSFPDFMIIAGSLWGMLAMLMNSPDGAGAQSGGSFLIDVLGCYLIGRAYITDVRRLRTFLIFALPGIVIVGIILVIESTTQRLLIAPFFPQRAEMDDLYETRLGLLRARAVFPHSIAAGMFMGSLLSLYFLSRVRPLYKWMGVIAGLTAIFTVSSSAFLMTVMLLALIAYRSFFIQLLKTREKLLYLVYGAIGVYAALEMFTGRGAIRTIINYASLNPRTGYYRLVIWEYGTASVTRHPWFGIGNAPMPRPSWMRMETIDNHWLMLAVRYGLPTAVLIGTGVLAAIWICVSRNSRLNDFDRATTLGAVFALTSLWIIAWTGALWANHVAWFMLLVGTVSALAMQMPRQAQPPKPISARRPMGVRRLA